VAFTPITNIDPAVRGWKDEEIDNSEDGKRIDPTRSIHDTWKGMEALVEMGLTKQIGVSNFPVMLLHELLSKCTITPAVNQVECHPYLQQTPLLKYCQKRGIHLQAYSPLGTPGYKGAGEPVVLDDPILRRIASRHGVSTARLCLTWALQRGTSVVVKSVSAEHQRDNLLAAAASAGREPALRLTNDEMAEIAALDRRYRFFRPEDWWGEMAMAVFD
jgi:alcohol dehydrogenase (NADP+)